MEAGRVSPQSRTSVPRNLNFALKRHTRARTHLAFVPSILICVPQHILPSQGSLGPLHIWHYHTEAPTKWQWCPQDFEFCSQEGCASSYALGLRSQHFDVCTPTSFALTGFTWAPPQLALAHGSWSSVPTKWHWGPQNFEIRSQEGHVSPYAFGLRPQHSDVCTPSSFALTGFTWAPPHFVAHDRGGRELPCGQLFPWRVLGILQATTIQWPYGRPNQIG